MVLIDQLDLLAATMDKVFDAVCRADADALVAHGRFLAEKFGSTSTGGALDVGSAPLPPMPGTGRRRPAPRPQHRCRLRGCRWARSSPAAGRAGRLMSTVATRRRPDRARPPHRAPRRQALDARRGGRRGGHARHDRWGRRSRRPRGGTGPRRGGGGVRAAGRHRLGTGRRRRHHPGLLRRREPRPPLARGAHGDPHARWRPSGPRTRRPTPKPWPRSPRPPARSASRPCASSATRPSRPPPSCPSCARPEPPVDRGRRWGTSSADRRARPGPGAGAARRPAPAGRAQPRHRRRSRPGASTSCSRSSTPSSGCSGSSGRSTGRSPCCGSRSCAWMPA